MIYYPDRWVMVKITSPKYGEIYKILAGWYGGYTQGDEWKLSSGTTKAIPNETLGTWHFHQSSGSTYICLREHYGTSAYTYSIYNSFVEQLASQDATIEILENLKDWTVLNYE